MTDPVVVVGGGQAAVQLCLALRKAKYEADILVFSEEDVLPYHRPPLSKAFITGKTDEETLTMRPASFYESRNIGVHLGAPVTSIDPVLKRVQTADGVVAYRSLVLATGAISRKLPIGGHDAAGVFELRDLADAKAIKHHLETTSRVIIIGAGFIGLEAAAVLNQTGVQVTIFDTAERVMGRAVSPQVSDWFTNTHRAAGITIFLNEGVSQIVVQDGCVCGVERSSGETLEADMVLVGIGVLPHTELAEAAGLHCDNGVVVDEYCRTSSPSVYAVGDCANHPNLYAANRRIRLESVQNATDQARVVAGMIAATENAGSTSAPYRAVPWFWSDQAEHSLQMAGLAFDVDHRVIRGNPDDGSFSVFQFSAGKLMAVDSVNSSRDHMLARKMLEAEVSPTFDQASDSGFELKTLL